VPARLQAHAALRTMDPTFIIRGWLIGFAIAAPVGPIGVLCIRRTLSDGRLAGFLSGLGAATADSIYGAIAAFGLTALQEALLRQQSWLRILGGLFLLYLGIRTLLAAPARAAAPAPGRRGTLGAYFSTLVLTLTNPATILAFLVIFAGFRLGEQTHSYWGAVSIVVGVFLGSASWWLLLSALVGLLRERFTAGWLRWVNRLAGGVICAFGVAALALS
jgi:threonine/homoserine/homoserine lactone efflux protein